MGLKLAVSDKDYMCVESGRKISHGVEISDRGFPHLIMHEIRTPCIRILCPTWTLVTDFGPLLVVHSNKTCLMIYSLLILTSGRMEILTLYAR